MKRIICGLAGHDISPTYKQLEERFVWLWSDLLRQKVPYEVFHHQCVRCGQWFEISRFTRDARKWGYR